MNISFVLIVSAIYLVLSYYSYIVRNTPKILDQNNVMRPSNDAGLMIFFGDDRSSDAAATPDLFFLENEKYELVY